MDVLAPPSSFSGSPEPPFPLAPPAEACADLTPPPTGPPPPRKVLRVPLPVCLVPEDGEPRFVGYLSDVSRAGAFLQTFRPWEIGSRGRVQLTLPCCDFPVVCEIEAVWSRGYGGRTGPSPGMGVAFVELDARALHALAEFCSEAVPAERARIEHTPERRSNEP